MHYVPYVYSWFQYEQGVLQVRRSMRQFQQSFSARPCKRLLRGCLSRVICAAILLGASVAWAQAPPATAEDADKKFGDYVVHQSIELGGRISDHNGSEELWKSFVNFN